MNYYELYVKSSSKIKFLEREHLAWLNFVYNNSPTTHGFMYITVWCWLAHKGQLGGTLHYV
jgi:hypothetical protein